MKEELVHLAEWNAQMTTLGRTGRALINLNYELKVHGANPRSLVAPTETETPEREYNIITCADARLESERIARRTKAGLDVARKKARSSIGVRQMTEARPGERVNC